ncbi:RHS repeat-associated core domain-containing protein [Longispora albida]|uniref:RHS repeat-associated core domain-containing protein n=1 Tax=Longispora albida TaxID=203523 RepID=UPI0003673CA7|nr:RHS repeat-associated core domain-containing protein [Longispora albida]
MSWRDHRVRTTSRRRPWLAGAFAAMMAVSLGVVMPLPEPEKAYAAPGAPAEKSISGRKQPVVPRGKDVTAEAAVRAAPAVTWPKAGSAEVSLGAGLAPAAAGDLPVKVSSSGTGKARVTVLDQQSSAQAGIAGVLFRVQRTDGALAAAPATVEFDYSRFRHAYGGDFGNRLAVVEVPECALARPRPAGCAPGRPLPGSNDPKAGKVRAEVTAGAPRRSSTLYAVTAGPSGSTGSFKPTSLSPSATWSVGLQSGDFGWTYPMDLPAMPGGEPEIALGYNSGGVDGRVASTNNQPSWAGEGFDFQPGYIERSYTGCAEDMAGSDITVRTGDQCWATWNAHVVLPGVGGELVRDDQSGTWRAEEDDGWRVELLTGADNGDDGDAGDKGEYWRLTSADGTQYFFGRNRLPGWQPGGEETRSTWTVPVYGNQPGEPCRAQSWCQQAYRWSLDYVVDRHGDVFTYWYDTETNHYARGTTGTVTPYVRAGYLKRIDYGQRADTVHSALPNARVRFDAADRCLPGSSCVRTQPADWPDTPFDQSCDAGSCALSSPSFWGTKRLAKVTAQVREGSGYSDVDSWTLSHTFPEVTDGTSSSLWLKQIVHTGLARGSAAMPAVTLDGVRLHNRVDGVEDGEPVMQKWRLSRIDSETGGRIDVTYSPTECASANLQLAGDNARRCFPVFWTPPLQSEPKLGWFHKQVVTQVQEIDRVGGNDTQYTFYDYPALGGAWHHDDAELTPERYKSWGQWRGFQKVTVRTGDPAKGKQTRTDHLFLRGMTGDVRSDGSRPAVEVTDSEGGRTLDRPVLRGFARETLVYDGTDGPLLSAELHEPSWVGPTATRNRAGGALEAYLTDVKKTRTRTALAGGGFRVTESEHGYDNYGQHIWTNDLGDLATADDDRFTEIFYTRNYADWILDTEYRTTTVGVARGTPASYPADIISDVRTYYDGASTLDAAPVRGDVTRSEEVSGWANGAPVYTTVETSTYDQHGRETSTTDALGQTDSTAFTPALGGPLTAVSVTNPLGHVETTEYDPVIGEPVRLTDENGRTTEQSYDPFGRLTGVWQPGRARTLGPNVKFEYLIQADAPPAVVSHRLLANGTYSKTYSYFDGELRQRQMQEPAPGGGRVLTDTRYDSHGRVSRANAPHFNTSAPGTDLLQVDDAQVPAQTVYEYDGAGRETAEILYTTGTEKWRTSTVYGGDRVTETPPAGGIPATRIFDADGQTTELRQHNGSGYDVTRYTYTKAGQQSAVTDPAGNVWRFHYDLRGRQIRMDDPDKGTSYAGYDDTGQLVSATDSRGRSLTYGYDPLGRKTAIHDGGTRLTEWTYDSILKGQPSASIRYVGGNAYKEEVTGYDDQDRPTGTKFTLPASEGALAAQTYDSTLRYNAVGQISSVTLPKIGNSLPAETLNATYDTEGRANGLNSNLTQYVAQTTYTKFGETDSYVLGVGAKQVRQKFDYEPGTRRLVKAGLAALSSLTTPIVQREYTYDPAGNLTKLRSTGKDQAADNQCFKTDYLRRLTEAWTATDDCAAAPALINLGGPAPYWHSYTFDKTGNRVTETQHAAAGDTTRAYTSPAQGGPQPHALSSVTTSGPAGTRTDTFGYDTDGNTTSRNVNGRNQQITWDSEGSVASIVEGGKTTSFVYDAEGDRLIRRDSTGTTLYLGNTEVHLDTTGLVTGTRYYEHNDDVVAVRTGPATLNWLVSDHHETGETSVNAADLTQVTHRRHLPYGDERGSPALNWPGQKGFVGGTIDKDTGLTHLGAREYDPATGRFISVDPIIDEEDPQQLHGYLYSNNNPLTYSDPDGLFWKSFLKTVAKVGEVLSYVPGPIGTAAGLASAGAHLALGNKGKAAEMALGAAANLVPGGKLLAKGAMALAKGVKGAKGLTAGGKAATSGKKAASATTGASKGAKGAGKGGTSKGGSCPISNSFTPATPVRMADGTYQPIGEIQAGDEVLTVNPLDGAVSGQPVLDVITGQGVKELVRVDLDQDDAEGITATAGHPFWVNGRGWVDASALREGDQLLAPDGSSRTVARVTYLGEVPGQTVHNLTVDVVPTYVVMADGQDVVVHNCGGGLRKAKKAAKKERSASESFDDHADAVVKKGLGVKVISEYTSPSGNRYFGRNGEGLVAPRSVKQILKACQHKGGCAEMQALNKAVRAEGKAALKPGGKFRTTNGSNNPAKHKTHRAACSRCEKVINKVTKGKPARKPKGTKPKPRKPARASIY